MVWLVVQLPAQYRRPANLTGPSRRRPSRERENLVKEVTRLVNRMKANLARLGIRGFRPHLAQAAGQLQTLQTPEGTVVPANTLAEMRRDMDRLRFVRQQIKQIEAARVQRLESEPGERRHAMVYLLARVVGIGVESADMLVQEVFSRKLRDRRAVARYAGLTGAPRDDPARLDSSSASEGQRASPVVSGTHRRRPRQNAQDHDYSVGSKTSDRALAAGDDRRSTGRFAHSTGSVMITWGSTVGFLQLGFILMPSCS